mgnify:CR=1 FL=1
MKVSGSCERTYTPDEAVLSCSMHQAGRATCLQFDMVGRAWQLRSAAAGCGMNWCVLVRCRCGVRSAAGMGEAAGRLRAQFPWIPQLAAAPTVLRAQAAPPRAAPAPVVHPSPLSRC